ncbi:MAG: 2,4'-dihydroxyacetophenone dioxygenase family protein [Gammaproteobacteria bacterium]|nr:2,4'-dihydroxyacetophenone dioxygenase family protein [Gammaproteobacteria bacterium]MBI5619025.1 2,4'-dihydroxyacetophenone dioxygenase family protein [Gammaproteobacteria bacterium]
MSEMRQAPNAIPAALHRGDDELPFVESEPGVLVKLVQVDIPTGLWVVRTRFAPGLTLQRHLHTGEVYAFTLSGSWRYLEYPEINRAGSYLFEPAGSIHTLHVLDSNTEPTDVWFAVKGANLNLNAEGKVEAVLNAHKMLRIYRKLCADMDITNPPVIGA